MLSVQMQSTPIRLIVAAGSDAAAVAKAVHDAVGRLEFLPTTPPGACRPNGPLGPGHAYELSLSVPPSLISMANAVRAAVLWEIETELRRRHLAVPYLENQPCMRPLVIDDAASGRVSSNDAADEIRRHLACHHANGRRT